MEGKLIAYHLRYTIRATEALELEQHPGSALRGSLFQALLKRFCVNQDAPECASCPLVQTCPVSALVAPLRDEFPRGRDVPRPFVVRPPLITASGLETTGLRLESGQQVTFGLTLFGKAGKLFPYVVLAAQMMEQNGLGRPLREHRWRRGRFALERIEAVHPFTGAQATLFERSKPQVRAPELAITAEDVAARAAALSPERISLHFLTPTRLTEHGALVHQPEPGALVRRLAERLDMLEHAYAPVLAQQPTAEMPRVAGRWRAVAEAADLQMTGSDTRWVDTKSYSSRQQRALPIGGFVGTLAFTGALTPTLRELLVWGEVVHVGKNCVKGDGWYQIEA
ncbi:MAG TPA: CRISPR system precrRNA processing endoribonuclease RAMP protein Cas6 [Ktedonobacterales bacterium]|nr:CRISPR system precrRNA processing endoribonuclease RAMP protein Cas6 [Ktedonobacterales bacterium]